METAKFTFPAVKGIQASMEYYVTMVPLECLSKLFTFSDENLAPDIRSQRTLNKARIPDLCNYIIENPTSYVFSALTASVDGDICFEPSSSSPDVGLLSISMSSRMLINDGQHRRAAIEAALKKKPELKYEHISIVLYHDLGLKRSQQMFSDLNRFAIRPTQSLNILYDSRDDASILLKEIIKTVPEIGKLVDKEHTSVPNRSVALFTLSALYHGTNALLSGLNLDRNGQLDLARSYWKTIYNNMPEWKSVSHGDIKSYIVRRDSLSPLSITLKALGHIGNELYQSKPQSWSKKLNALEGIDWSKTNPLWSNGIVVNGSVQLSRATQKQMIETLRTEIGG